MGQPSKQDYIDRAYREIEKAEARIGTYAGDCADCRWSKRGGYMGLMCGHGAVECAAFNVSDAYAKNRIQFCSEQRDKSSVWGPVLCGPDGALFEAR
jgi:hypothetical protein